MNSDQVHRRFNPLTQDWVMVSPHRNNRPWLGEVSKEQVISHETYKSDCYLCPGNVRSSGVHNPLYKDTFVFANDFSAILPTSSHKSISNSLLISEKEEGYCKVICYHPDHNKTMALMQAFDIENIIKVWQNETQIAISNPKIEYLQIFENKGEIMGCSNPHPHGQLWAQSTIPKQILTKKRSFELYNENKNRHLLEDYLQEEKEQNVRIIDENEAFVSLVPYWAVWPFEIMIIPKKRVGLISDLDSFQVKKLSDILLKTTVRYDNLFKVSFPYSMGIHQSPVKYESNTWHFHISFFPPLLRSSSIKKYMVGYELFANPQRDITPEKAAEILKKCPLKHYLL